MESSCEASSEFDTGSPIGFHKLIDHRIPILPGDKYWKAASGAKVTVGPVITDLDELPVE